MTELYIVTKENNVCAFCPMREFTLQVVDRHYHNWYIVSSTSGHAMVR